MTVSTPNKVVGASVFAPAAPEQFYEAVRDVRGFPVWAPGVRRVEVFERPGEPGMVSEWEVSFLGFRRKVLSVLEEAERPEFLRWTYEGPITGWGECRVRPQGNGALAEFRTEIVPEEPLLEGLMMTAPARSAAQSQLKRSLARLGQLVCGDRSMVRVGPLMDLRQTRQREEPEPLPRIA
ncbi:MAG: SRPBCC family protein [Rubrobacteraceae bacterium]|jgi:hypothetical protein